MVCHGELARLKPGAKHLTLFYLMVAGGGAMGGVFVAVLAPQLFSGFWEYQAGLGGTAALLCVVLLRDRESWLRRGGGRALHLWIGYGAGVPACACCTPPPVHTSQGQCSLTRPL